MPEPGYRPLDKNTEELATLSKVFEERFNFCENSKEDQILKAVTEIKDRLDVIEGKVSQGLALINGIWR